MWIFGLIVAGFSIVSLVLPWLLRSRIHDLEARLYQLERNTALSALPQEKENPFVGNANLAPEKASADEHAQAAKAPPPMQPDFIGAAPVARKIVEDEAEQDLSPSGFFELFAGTKLPVWIGAIAIVFAVIYLVRYTIEIGLLTPEIRLAAGFGFGLLLLGTAQFIDYFATLTQSRRIAQALTAAGLGGCYASTYAAYALYHFIPAGAAFAILATIAALGVFLSLRQGVAIALLSSLFGFLTPGLISTDHPNFYLLFGYLYVLFLLVSVLARRRSWPALAGLGIFMALGWTAIWIGFFFVASASWAASLFLIAVTFTTVLLFADLPDAREPGSPAWLLHLGGACSGIVLAAAIMPLGDYVTADAMLYGVLTAGLAFLAYRDEARYRPLFFLASIMSFLLLLSWKPISTGLAIAMITTTAAFIGFHLLFIAQRRNTMHWSIFGVSSLLAGFLLLWGRFDNFYIDLVGIPHFWGVAALGCALIAGALGFYARVRNIEPRDRLTAIYAGGTAALITIAAAIEVEHHWLPLAYGIEALGFYAAFDRLRLKNYLSVPTALVVALLFSLAPFLTIMTDLVFGTLGGSYSFHLNDIDPHLLPLQLGIPGLALWGSCIFAGRESPQVTKFLVYSGTLLASYAVYFTLRQPDFTSAAHMIMLAEPGFTKRATITLTAYAAGLALLHTSTLGKEWKDMGLTLFIIAALRSLYFDVLIGNPLFISSHVGTVPFFNSLALAYLLPAAALAAACRRDFLAGFPRIAAPAVALLLGFVFINLTVRQLYHGADLTVGPVSNAEIYSYSLAWLIFGVGVLAGGIYTDDQKLRYVSLAVLLLTVSKVFLYDASELSGLYRVGSFLGLGLSLIAISYVYSRLVFRKNV